MLCEHWEFVSTYLVNNRLAKHLAECSSNSSESDVDLIRSRWIMDRLTCQLVVHSICFAHQQFASQMNQLKNKNSNFQSGLFSSNGWSMIDRNVQQAVQVYQKIICLTDLDFFQILLHPDLYETQFGNNYQIDDRCLMNAEYLNCLIEPICLSRFGFLE